MTSAAQQIKVRTFELPRAVREMMAEWLIEDTNESNIPLNESEKESNG